MSEIYKCPNCNGKNVMRERRPDGNTVCNDCGLTLESSKWDKEVKEREFLFGTTPTGNSENR